MQNPQICSSQTINLKMNDLIQRLHGKYTVVIVTHNLAQARRIANYAGFFWIKDLRAGCLIKS